MEAQRPAPDPQRDASLQPGLGSGLPIHHALGDSRRLGLFGLVMVLGLCALGIAGNRWWIRQGPLNWSNGPPVRLVSRPESGFRLAPFEQANDGPAKPTKAGQRPAGNQPSKGAESVPTGKAADLGAFQVDPNSASEEELCALPAIGPVLAKRIIAARSLRPFQKVEDMRRVSGIGPKTLEKLRPHLAFGKAQKGETGRGESKPDPDDEDQDGPSNAGEVSNLK